MEKNIFDDPPPQFQPPATLPEPQPAQQSNLPFGGMLIPVLLFFLSVYFWESMLVYPIKLLTVFFHELSHGLAAIATGGSIQKIELTADQGGVCYTIGGIRFLILSAGYLGSLIWGSTLFLLAAKTRLDRPIVGTLGGIILLVTVLFVRSTTGIIFGLLFGAAMIALAKYANEVICDQFLRYLGLTSCFYVIVDIKSDLIDRSVAISDASRLAEMLHLPGFVVGGVWFLMALFISYKVLQMSTDKS